jgi:hypothetical protein
MKKYVENISTTIWKTDDDGEEATCERKWLLKYFCVAAIYVAFMLMPDLFHLQYGTKN